MSCPGSSESGEGDGERVIDRSGDIDQRPPEERSSAPSNIVVFSGGVRVHQGTRQAGRGLNNHVVPPIPFPTADSSVRDTQHDLSNVARQLQKELDAQCAKANWQLESIERKIEAQEKRCVAPKLDGELQQVHFQRQKILIANGPQLADHLRDERNRLADLERFKADHHLNREAHYPSSPVLAIGILLMLILVEACVNGVFFAASSDQGLFGGWIEAFVLSLTNVGVAFLIGQLVLPQLNRRGVFSRLGAIAASLASIGILIAVNLFGAHYRDYRAEAAKSELVVAQHPSGGQKKSIVLNDAKPADAGKTAQKIAKPSGEKASNAAIAPIREQSVAPDGNAPQKTQESEREAIRRVLASPFNFQSFSSLFLLVIGLSGATIAAWDGYKFDDPYPGYGRRHRRHMEARADGAHALRRILSQTNTIMSGNFQAINNQIDSFSQELAALASLHHTYAGEWKTLSEGLAEATRKAEAELAFNDRLANKVPGRGSR